jgi:DNA-binding Lrp family transcriptional regulator
MATRAYVLIEAAVGQAKAVAEGISGMSSADARVVAADSVTGPYDVIAVLEADDLNHLANAITDGVQQVDGIRRTTTCLVAG